MQTVRVRTARAHRSDYRLMPVVRHQGGAMTAINLFDALGISRAMAALNTETRAGNERP